MTSPFLESPRFPDNIAFGGTVGPTYLTVVNTVYSGRDGRIPAWSQARIRFEIGRRTMGAADTATLDAFFRTVKGRAYGFRIKDWTDFTVTTANGVCTPTTTANVYQLGKLYLNGSMSETRLIQKPVVGSVAAYVNNTPNVFTLDTTTGLITFGPKASSTITAVGVGATTTITTALPLTGAAVGLPLIASGLTGANAATLNGQQFTVTNITGNVYTLNANTTGLTITATGGTGALSLYVQGSDVLSWAGQFDVPVRFDADEMKKQIMDRNGAGGDLLVNWDSIPIIEIRI